MLVAGSHSPPTPNNVLNINRAVISAERWALSCSTLLNKFGTSPRLLKKLLTPVRTKRGVTY
ncbi:hypothetical protein D3C71_2043530 [compost metagenome]